MKKRNMILITLNNLTIFNFNISTYYLEVFRIIIVGFNVKKYLYQFICFVFFKHKYIIIFFTEPLNIIYSKSYTNNKLKIVPL